MFWGLIMEPQKRYTQVVKKDFHISMASLDVTSTASNEPAQIMCSYEDKNYLLCTLRNPDLLHCQLDLYFEVGSKISFATNGKQRVHLTGYLTKDDEEFGMEEGEEEEGEGSVEEETSTKKSKTSLTSVKEPPRKKIKTSDLLTSELPDDDDDDESDDSDFDFDKLLEGSDEEQSEEEAGEEVDDEDVSDEDDDDESMDEDIEDEDELDEEEVVEKPATNGLSAKQLKKKNKEAQGTPKKEKQVKGKTVNQTPGPKVKKPENGASVESKKQEGKKAKENQAAQGSKKRTLPGGVIVEDIKDGNGDAASNGKFVHVYYEGRLKSNNKVFDKTQNGPGFGFRLGKGEVIKGWDLGVNGMKVGGKRRITCPPHLAYGAKGSPPVIPPNSTLVFEVEMKKVK